MKTASFVLHATALQSARWKQAAEAEGFASVGSWAALALDAYLKARARAGLPVPLAWHRGSFRVELESGPQAMPGFISPPFGAFRGTAAGWGRRACHRYTLVYVPSGRVLATVRTFAQCKTLAGELARQWFRSEEGPAPIIDRHQSC